MVSCHLVLFALSATNEYMYKVPLRDVGDVKSRW